MILRKLLIGLVLAALVGTPVWLQHRARAAESSKAALLQGRILEAQRFAVDNGLLSNIVAKARGSQSLSAAQLSELLRLRNEVWQLLATLNETNRLAHEIGQLRAGIKDLSAEKETNEDSPTALLDTSQKELRMARVARLRKWLTGHPNQKIPELRFLSEADWMRSARRTPVTDEEYDSWMSILRDGAEDGFSQAAFNALKAYETANSGAFPTGMSELKPYFTPPLKTRYSNAGTLCRQTAFLSNSCARRAGIGPSPKKRL